MANGYREKVDEKPRGKSERPCCGARGVVRHLAGRVGESETSWLGWLTGHSSLQGKAPAAFAIDSHGGGLGSSCCLEDNKQDI